MKSICIMLPLVSASLLALATPALAQKGPLCDGHLYLQNKLNNIIIPKVDFEDMTMHECVDFLREQTVLLDPETDENKKGVNFLTTGDAGKYKIDRLRIKNVPIFILLRYLCAKTGSSYTVDGYSVIIYPAGKYPFNQSPKGVTCPDCRLVTPPGGVVRPSEDGVRPIRPRYTPKISPAE